MINALSPEKNELLIRWPPDGYQFYESNYYSGDDEGGGYDEGGAYLKDASILRDMYPDISHWKNVSCVNAWFDFVESKSWASTYVPDRYFLAFLYAKQELGDIYDHGGLDEFDKNWKALGK